MRSTRYFEGVAIYTSKIGRLKHGAAFALPGIGIFVNPGDIDNTDLLRHEFGHILQARKWGYLFFYKNVVPASIKSALKAGKLPLHEHMETWTEWTANFLAYHYFNQPSDWQKELYPLQPKVCQTGSIPPVPIV